MRRLALTCLIMALPAYSQAQDKKDFNDLLALLAGKCWVISKDCYRDSCFRGGDSSYYFLQHSWQDRVRDTSRLCFGWGHAFYISDPITDSLTLMVNVCRPMICFRQRTGAYTAGVWHISEAGYYDYQLQFTDRDNFYFSGPEHRDHSGPFSEHYRSIRVPAPLRGTDQALVQTYPA